MTPDELAERVNSKPPAKKAMTPDDLAALLATENIKAATKAQEAKQMSHPFYGNPAALVKQSFDTNVLGKDASGKVKQTFDANVYDKDAEGNLLLVVRGKKGETPVKVKANASTAAYSNYAMNAGRVIRGIGQMLGADRDILSKDDWGRTQAIASALGEQYPKSALAGGVAGAVTEPVTLLSSLALPIPKSLAQMSGQGALLGAGAGALGYTPEGESRIENALWQGGAGAALGPIFGGAINAWRAGRNLVDDGGRAMIPWTKPAEMSADMAKAVLGINPPTPAKPAPINRKAIVERTTGADLPALGAKQKKAAESELRNAFNAPLEQQQVEHLYNLGIQPKPGTTQGDYWDVIGNLRTQRGMPSRQTPAAPGIKLEDIWDGTPRPRESTPSKDAFGTASKEPLTQQQVEEIYNLGGEWNPKMTAGDYWNIVAESNDNKRLLDAGWKVVGNKIVGPDGRSMKATQLQINQWNMLQARSTPAATGTPVPEQIGAPPPPPPPERLGFAPPEQPSVYVNPKGAASTRIADVSVDGALARIDDAEARGLLSPMEAIQQRSDILAGGARNRTAAPPEPKPLLALPPPPEPVLYGGRSGQVMNKPLDEMLADIRMAEQRGLITPDDAQAKILGLLGLTPQPVPVKTPTPPITTPPIVRKQPSVLDVVEQSTGANIPVRGKKDLESLQGEYRGVLSSPLDRRQIEHLYNLGVDVKPGMELGDYWKAIGDVRAQRSATPANMDKAAINIAKAKRTPKKKGSLTYSNTLARESGWVIRNKDSGEVIMETYDKAKVNALNTEKYEAVPILEYLQGLNKKGLASTEAGGVTVQLAGQLGSPAIGAVAGAAYNPDDPQTGALAGAAIGSALWNRKYINQAFKPLHKLYDMGAKPLHAKIERNPVQSYSAIASGLSGMATADDDAPLSERLLRGAAFAAGGLVGSSALLKALPSLRQGLEWGFKDGARWQQKDPALGPLYKEMRDARATFGDDILQDAIDTVESTAKLSPAERKTVNFLITGEGDPGPAPKNLNDAAIEIRKVLTKWGEQAVNMGYLPKDVYEQRVKDGLSTWLHRSYMSKINPKYLDSWIARQTRIIGNAIKPRGYTVTVSDKEVSAMLASSPGSKVLSTDGFGKTKIRMQLTFEQRQKMGEIQDVAYNVLKSGEILANDLSAYKFFDEIANSPIAKPAEFAATNPEYVVVPTSKIAQTNVFEYGNLAGRAVPKWVMDDLKVQNIAKGAIRGDYGEGAKMAANLWQLHKEVMGAWKISKTALNPVTHYNNLVSNALLYDWADGSFKDLGEGVKSVITRSGPWFQEAERAGVFKANYLQGEIGRMRREALDALMKANEGQETADIGTMLKSWDVAKQLWRKTGGKMIDFYQVVDDYYRMGLYITRRKAGDDEAAAAAYARKWLIDYNIDAPVINVLRHTAMPFVSWSYRAAPLIVETATLRPWKLAKVGAMVYAFNQIGERNKGGDTEKEREQFSQRDKGSLWGLEGIMPKQMVALPAESGSRYINITNTVPGSGLVDTNDPNSIMPASMQANFGYVGDIAKAYSGLDPFGKPIKGLGQGKLSDLQLRTESLLSRQVPLINSAINVKRSFTGEYPSGLSTVQTPEVAIINAMGPKVVEVDPQLQRKMRTITDRKKRKALSYPKDAAWMELQGAYAALRKAQQEYDEDPNALNQQVLEWREQTYNEARDKLKEAATETSRAMREHATEQRR